jgi:hypothetical protein
MNLPPSMTLSAGDDLVTVKILGRMHPGADDYWDGNWLLSPIEIQVGGFSGEVPAGLRSEELRRFREQLERLYRTLEGEARLESIEEWILLVCQGDGMGHINVKGFVRDRPGIGNRLNFDLCFDQTHLPSLLDQLRKIEAAYPELGRP